MQNLASIQKRTSPVKFAHLAEKSGKDSISNLSTKVSPQLPGTARVSVYGNNQGSRGECGGDAYVSMFMASYKEGSAPANFPVRPDQVLRTPVNNIEYFPPYFEGLILGCIDADFCK